MDNLLQALKSCGDYFDDSFVITDLNQEDQPLIYVNDSFVGLTGYERTEILGKNCRFLQGPLTDKETIQNIRTAIRERKCNFFDLLNHKKNGEVFWNRLVLLPIGYNEDEIDYFIGIQQKVTDKYDAEDYFLKNVSDKEIATEVKNPFWEILNSNRSFKYLNLDGDDENLFEEIKSKIITEVKKINEYIKSI